MRFPIMKKIITIRKSDLGILKSIFDGTLVNTKIKLRYVRFLLSVKVNVQPVPPVHEKAFSLIQKGLSLYHVLKFQYTLSNPR